ncbi:VOC family protein [Halobellus salinisoli]|uniref:VOC family protein n=1 Tax=Halobellus salinisoli TaxID=3108500 RepID=UPI003008D2BF
MESGYKSEDISIPSVDQVGIVVKDLDDGMDRFSAILGLDSWVVFRFEPPKLKNTTYQGEEVDYTFRAGLANIGSFQIELVEPLEGESAYTNHLKTYGEGLHHIVCFSFDDPHNAVNEYKNAGVPLLQQAEFGDGEFWYLDTRDVMNGTILEIVDVANDEPDRVYNLD